MPTLIIQSIQKGLRMRERFKMFFYSSIFFANRRIEIDERFELLEIIQDRYHSIG